MTFPLLWSELEPMIDKHGLRSYIFIETGVYHGDTMYEMCDHFDRMIGIDIDPLCNPEYLDGMHIMHGDSAQLLQSFLTQQRPPAVIYLDAHWWRDAKTPVPYGDNPLLAELAAIRLHNQTDLVIIDDAHLFGLPYHELDMYGVDHNWHGITVASVMAVLGHSRIVYHSLDEREHTPANPVKKHHLWLSLRKV